MGELDDTRILAARAAARANLQEIRLFSIEGSLDQLPERRGLSYSYESTIEVQAIGHEAIIVDGDYKLIVNQIDSGDTEADSDDIEENEPSAIAHMEFKLAALYHVDKIGNDNEFTDRELDAFGQTTGQLTLHPYARELIANLTGRMGLPALQLKVLQIPIDKPEPKDIDT